jgi:hypothetical protein
MRDLEAVIAALGPRLSGARIVRGREIHGSVKAGDALRLAQTLRADFGAELRLMVANDRRGDLDAFEVYYLYAPPSEDWFLHARRAIPIRARSCATASGPPTIFR